MEQNIFHPDHIHFNTQFVSAVLHSSIVSRTDRSGVIIYVNSNFEAISGYTKEELIGKPHSVVSSGIHPREFWLELWRTIAHGKTWRGEVCNRAKDGSLYWVDTFVYPYFNEDKELQGFFSVRNDITQRKLQRIELLKSSAQLKVIFNSTTDAYFLIDADLNLIAYNNQAHNLIGDDVKHENMQEAFIKLFMLQEGARDRLNRALNNETVEVENELVLLDKTKRWYQIRYMPAFDEEHRLMGVSINLFNIHARKIQETKLIESEIRLRAIINSTTEAYFLISSDLRLLTYNETGRKFIGNFTEHQDIEREFLKLWQIQEGWRERLQLALSGQLVELEKQSSRFDGTKVWESIRYFPAFDDEHKIIGASISISNIQTRKAQEKALLDIAWRHSHEMRRPVVSILGLIQLLQRDEALITNSEFMKHIKTMAEELDSVIKKNVRSTEISSFE